MDLGECESMKDIFKHKDLEEQILNNRYFKPPLWWKYIDHIFY